MSEPNLTKRALFEAVIEYAGENPSPTHPCRGDDGWVVIEKKVSRLKFYCIDGSHADRLVDALNQCVVVEGFEVEE